MKLTYRPEIDGLRAIAVISVIIYHSKISLNNFPVFKGGFIGVDIFFVISGYLITSIILKELVTTGSFSIKYFYERRIRRILPALLVVMLASIPLAWLYLLPDSLIDFSKSVLYSLGFSSNFYFHYSGQEYAAESGLFKPFLHTWSLSVEEQYYILFPTLILIIFKFFRTYLIHSLIFGFFISLGLAEWGSKNYPSYNFYILPTRGWELLAGSILAYFEIKLGHRNKNQNLGQIITLVGMILILHSVLFYHDKMFHPSFYTLSPIIGVCLIIWFSNKNDLITRILSTKVFVGTGLISYSLYLWHYPILAFARTTFYWDKNVFVNFIIGAIIVILSMISFYFIERPFRNKTYKFKNIFLVIVSAYFIVGLFSISGIINKGYKDRLPDIFIKDNDSKIKILDKIAGIDVVDNNIYFSSDKNKRNIFLVGDSHAETLAYDLYEKTKDEYNFSTSIFSGCQLILNINKVNKKTFKSKNCNYLTQQSRLDFINKTNNSIIILFGRLPMLLEEERFFNDEFGFKEGDNSVIVQDKDNTLTTKDKRRQFTNKNYISTIDKLRENNHKVILVYPVPEVGIDVPKIVYENYKFNKHNSLFLGNNYFSSSFELFKKRTKSSFDLLNLVKGEDIYRIYPHKLFCNSLILNRCVTHDENFLFYSDNNHPSYKGAKMINELLIKTIKKIDTKD